MCRHFPWIHGFISYNNPLKEWLLSMCHRDGGIEVMQLGDEWRLWAWCQCLSTCRGCTYHPCAAGRHRLRTSAWFFSGQSAKHLSGSSRPWSRGRPGYAGGQKPSGRLLEQTPRYSWVWNGQGPSQLKHLEPGWGATGWSSALRSSNSVGFRLFTTNTVAVHFP